MKRGRPVSSQIRQNIIEILYFLGKSYGYDIYKVYMAVFPKITMRSVYYQLRKGVELEELKVERVIKEKGNYSWGSEAEKIYYKLGANAKPSGDKRIREYLEKIGKHGKD
ncbi:hypothetical protein A3K72_02330 [Candidatus Woesearchaeota archaeon RBG_13_36_6]|nr:MAG: hypothetical protein A3K72_02330 [Candidatus Woesearchaeota archaeon RBG_13_36_6]